jgi:alpha,alpha-trehalase
MIEGLLISEMYETAHGHIMNLLDMLKRFGFVPNGGRIYYLNRRFKEIKLKNKVNLHY